MRYFLSIILPIVLLTLGFWYSFNIHKKYLLMWRKEASLKEFLIYSFPTFIKSIAIMFLIIFIHNTFHNHDYKELILFVLVFFVFSIFQSPWSLGGFLTKSKNLFYSAKLFYSDKSSRADRFVNKIIDIFIGRGQILVKILIFIGFIIVFIPNITLFITTNILYFLLLFILVGLSLIMNNIIYFGFVSLMIFQFDPVSITFTNINYLVLILSYLVIIIGLSLENRLEKKMFFIITVMEVKNFNFKLGYNTLFNKKNVTLYQNALNRYYYVYFRNIGLVVVYYCDFDISLSETVMRQLVKEGKKHLLSNNELAT